MLKEIEPSESAKKLAKIVGGEFYLVGGFVRNSLLGRSCEDEDLCSALTLDKLEKKLAGSEFSLKNKNKTLGTCKIVTEDKSFDYATFRKETYVSGHTPSEVVFVSDLQTDAQRRDFTVNSIYYEINSQKIIDPFDGITDLKKKRIRVVGPQVMQDDGIRIFRMLRLVGEYGFTIVPQTLAAAQKNISNIKDLSKQKMAEEIQKLFNRTTNKGAAKAIYFYNKLGIWKKLGFDFDHIVPHMIARCDDKFKAFVIDMIDAQKPASVSYFVTKVLDETGLSKKKEAEFINVISGYYDALNHLKNKQYFFKYFDNFPQIYEILIKKSKFLAQKYNFFYRYIIAHKLVIKTTDLKITAKDLKKNFPSMPEKAYEGVLMEALSDVFDGKCVNATDALIKNIGKRHYHKFK